MATLHPITASLQGRWAALGPRERRALQGAALVLGAALLWSVALAPALRTLAAAPAQNARLGAELERMQTLQARAKQLQTGPLAGPQNLPLALQSAANALGPEATLQVQGERATITLKRVGSAKLAAWLAPAAGSHPGPSEAQLKSEGSATEPLWSGTLVFYLPAAGTP